MIKENQRFLNRLHILSDGVLVFLSMLAAHWMRFSLFDGVGGLPMRYYLWLGAGAAALYLVSFGAAGLYRSHRAVRFYKEASRTLLVSALDVLILTAVLFALHLDNMSRWLLGFFYLVSSALLLGKRMCLRVLLHRFRAKGYNLKHVVLVGSGTYPRSGLRRIWAIRWTAWCPTAARGAVFPCWGNTPRWRRSSPGASRTRWFWPSRRRTMPESRG